MHHLARTSPYLTTFGLLTLSLIATANSVDARPLLPTPPNCTLAGASDIDVDPLGSAAFVADTDNNRVIALSQGFGCSAFVLTESDGTPFSGPSGVALDSGEQIFVADTGNDRIAAFVSITGIVPGNFIAEVNFNITGATLNAPQGLGFDDQDRLLIADTGNGRIVRVNTGGGSATLIGSPAADPDNPGAGELVTPVDVAVCPASAVDAAAGRIYVADPGADRIAVFAEDGTPLRSISTLGGARGQVSNPSGIAVDTRCNVYVTDRTNGRTQMFAGGGDYLEIMSELQQPRGIAVSSFAGASGGVFVTSPGGLQRLEYIDYDTDGDLLIDTDGDALPDIWEENGIDIGFDGTIDFVLPNADSRRKNLYVEVDFTQDQFIPLAPEDPAANDALDRVVNAFAAAPVENPDGSTGIDLHIERGEVGPFDGELMAFSPDAETLEAFPDIPFFFDNVKRALYGTPAERADSDTVLEAKSLAYRYALMVDSYCETGALENGVPVCTDAASYGGIAELPGDDFMFRATSSFSAQRVSGLFMHELGHTLGIQHGGDVANNCKPNYLSVMNYLYSTGLPNDAAGLPYGIRLDYSDTVTATLDEADLDEPTGVGLAPRGPDGSETDFVRWSTDGIGVQFERGDRPFDWNRNGDASETGVAVNINDTPNDLCNGIGTVHSGWNDWQNLIYSNRTSGNFGSGQRDNISDDEPSHADMDEIDDAWDAFRQPRFGYAAKFICVPEVGPEAAALSPGRYRTVVNIHNPTGDTVPFTKRVVIAHVEGTPRGSLSAGEPDELRAGEAMAITCPSIAARFEAGEAQLGDGFVLIDSNTQLVVTAVYTARDSVDVETISPTDRAEPDMPDDTPENPPRLADLTLSLPLRIRESCPNGRSSCDQTVAVVVTNASAEDVTDPIEILVTLSNGATAQNTLPGLLAGTDGQILLTTAPGAACYTPNCSAKVVVDPNDLIPESDETNNSAIREDRG